MENEENFENKENQNKDFTAFAVSAMRGGRPGIYQQQLASLIVKINRTDNSLKKIYNICMLALASKHKDKFDMALVEVCFKVCNSLLNTLIDKKSTVRIAWSFPQTQENYDRYIQPWQHIRIRFYALHTHYGQKNYPLYPRGGFHTSYDVAEQARELDEVGHQIAKEISEMPEYTAFFERTSALSLDSFYALKSEFECWSLTELAQIQTVVAEEVDPQVYREMLELSQRQTPTEKQEAEKD